MSATSTVVSNVTKFGGPGVGIITSKVLTISDDSGHSRQWDVTGWQLYGTGQGRPVYFNPGDLSDSGHQAQAYLIPWRTGVWGSKFDATRFLADPAADDARRDAAELELESRNRGIFHAIVKSVSKAVSQVGAAAGDVAEWGISVNEAVLHPLTISKGGLALSNESVSALEKTGASQAVIDSAQLVTKIGGYVTLGGAAVTAAGGIGATADFISSGASTISGAVEVGSGALGLYQTVNGILQPVTDEPPPSLPAPKSSSLPVGPLIAAGLIGFVLVIALAKKG